MQIKPKQGWFLAFTAVFAVLAGFVFLGTWSTAISTLLVLGFALASVIRRKCA